MNFAFCVKFLFAIIIGLTLISNSHAEVTTETFETMMNFTINECKVKENASDEDVVAIMSLDGDWPDTRGGKCFLDCFLEEVGIFKDHKFYKRGFLALALMLFEQTDGDDSQEITQIHETFSMVNKKCSAVKSTDRCDNAFEFATCFDLVMESLYIGNDVSLSDELENKN